MSGQISSKKTEREFKMAKEKSQAALLKEKLFYKKVNASKKMSDEQIKSADEFCENYKIYLDKGKTEREACSESIEMAIAAGFKEFKIDTKYNPGDKIYCVNRKKSIILAIIGNESISKGVKMAAAHIDSPRLDLKQNPLYESEEMALFKTHYYGGIKKYQWTVIPLALHGVIFDKDGKEITVNIGEDDNDPIFCVSDLLPHLAQDQSKRSLPEGIKGEELNIIVGSRCFKDDEASETVKLNILNILFEKYGITEADFLSAELEAVPNYKAKDVGFDRSLIGAYGQDDRVCAYTALKAILDFDGIPESTIVTVLTDKEETGSDGNTGLKSAYLSYFIADLAKPYGVEGRTVLSNSECLSADVNAGFDPTFPDVMEKKNAAFLNYGVVVTKFTGARGKSGTSDASAEFISKVRNVLNKHDVIWQTAELGKVDLGGGGTVAAYIANLNVDVVDLGVGVLSMHAPLEITSKLDVYMIYKAFEAFFK